MTTDGNRSVFGQRIRARREDVRLSQTQLGVLAGVHRNTIASLESGRDSDISTVMNSLRALGCGGVVVYAHMDAPGSIVPVLSVGLTRNITTALTALTDDPDVLAELTAAYFELVDAAHAAQHGAPAALPASFARFRDALPFTGPNQRAHMDVELGHIFGSAYPYLTQIAPANSAHNHAASAPRLDVTTGPAGGRGRVVTIGLAREADTAGRKRPEIERVVRSGLPEHLQVELIQRFVQRRAHIDEQVDALLSAEVDEIITRTRISLAEGGQPDGDRQA